MERNSIVYKARRKLQVFAHAVIPDASLSKLYYRLYLKKPLNLENPQTFNEKIQWMKLYYYPKNPTVVQCADKYAAREYVAQKGYGDKLVPLLGVWNDAREIDWEKLPDRFVLKCTHGCAYNIVVNDKTAVDRKQTERQLNSWLKEDFGAFNVEIHYSAIENRRIICEEFLGDKLIDYKFFCFNGEPKCIYISKDLIHDRQAEISFFSVDGSAMSLQRDDYKSIGQMEHPAFLNEMVEAARTLSADFPFVRVDFFIANGTYYFAELTFTPGAGMMPFNPESYDLEWGNMLHIENLTGSGT